MGTIPSKPLGEVTPYQANQFGRFVEVFFEKIKVDYSNPRVQEQRDHVQYVVNKIANRIGKNWQIFKVTRIVKTGSFYKQTKLLEANEFDYILLLALAYDKSKVDILIDNSDNMNWGEVIIKDPTLKEELNALWTKACKDIPRFFRFYNEDESKITFKKIFTESGKLSNNVSSLLLYLVHKCLLEFDSPTLTYLGYKDMDDLGYKLILNKNEIMLDSHMSGPSIGLTLGGPLCTADIDLTFCMEEAFTPKGRQVIAPYIHDRALWGVHYCGYPCSHWTLSLCDYPKGSRIKLDASHRKIVVLLKYIKSIKFAPRHIPSNSHVITTLVERHQESCQMTHVGYCFADLISHYWTYYYDQTFTSRNNWGLWDVDFPEVNLMSPILMAINDPPTDVLEEIGCLLDCLRTNPDWEEKLKVHKDDLEQFKNAWNQLVEEEIHSSDTRANSRPWSSSK